jgi:hypothetical protein
VYQSTHVCSGCLGRFADDALAVAGDAGHVGDEDRGGGHSFSLLMWEYYSALGCFHGAKACLSLSLQSRPRPRSNTSIQLLPTGGNCKKSEEEERMEHLPHGVKVAVVEFIHRSQHH